MGARIDEHLDVLCNRVGNRHVGSPGNVQATEYVRDVLRSFGFEVDYPKLSCMEWEAGDVSLSVGDEEFAAHPGPYSLSYAGEAELACASSAAELESQDLTGCVVLLHGELAREPLFPKGFVFYNPEEHQRIYRIVERKRPAVVAAATGRCPETAGASYPFPLFEDGDFDIPNAYMTDTEGDRLRRYAGQRVRLSFESRRIPAVAHNVIATKRGTGTGRVVLTAHIDAKKGSPGALDNGAGVATLLAVAELLDGYGGEPSVEIAILNGEDYYAATGEMAYLKANEGRWGEIRLCMNVDDAGYVDGKTVHSFYACPDELRSLCESAWTDHASLAPGPQWYQGDHSMFAQQGVPSVAFASEQMDYIAREIVHTDRDTVELVDACKLAQVATAVVDCVKQLPT